MRRISKSASRSKKKIPKPRYEPLAFVSENKRNFGRIDRYPANTDDCLLQTVERNDSSGGGDDNRNKWMKQQEIGGFRSRRTCPLWIPKHFECVYSKECNSFLQRLGERKTRVQRVLSHTIVNLGGVTSVSCGESLVLAVSLPRLESIHFFYLLSFVGSNFITSWISRPKR